MMLASKLVPLGVGPGQEVMRYVIQPLRRFAVSLGWIHEVVTEAVTASSRHASRSGRSDSSVRFPRLLRGASRSHNSAPSVRSVRSLPRGASAVSALSASSRKSGIQMRSSPSQEDLERSASPESGRTSPKASGRESPKTTGRSSLGGASGRDSPKTTGRAVQFEACEGARSRPRKESQAAPATARAGGPVSRQLISVSLNSAVPNETTAAHPDGEVELTAVSE